MARQDPFEKSDRPLLKRLGKQGVVRVSHRLARHVPRRLPVHTVLIDEEAHKLCDRDRWMRIVELDSILLVELRRIRGCLEMNAHHVLERAGDEEILLLEPKLLALEACVVRIEDLAERRGAALFLDSSIVVASVERLEVERVDSLRPPQAEHIGGVHPKPQDRRIVGDPLDEPLWCPANAIVTALVGVMFSMAAKANCHCDFRARNFPRIAKAQPLVRDLDLPTVADLLVEDAELIADAVTDGRDLERCHRINVASCKTPEAAVAEARLLFLIAHILETEPKLRHGLLCVLEGPEIEEIVAEMRTQQEFG